MFVEHLGLRKAPAYAVLMALLVTLSGCPLSPDSDDGDEPPTETRAPERTTILGAIDLMRWAWANKNADQLDQVLHDEYEYFPIADDEFPWIPQDGWNKTIEMAIARNMFDPTFISEDTGENVDSIEMTFTVRSTRALTSPPNAVEVSTELDAQVLWAEGDGATSHVLIDFVIVPDLDEPELFQVLEQRERSLI